MNHPDLTPILTISHHLLNGWSVGGRGGEVIPVDINGFGACPGAVCTTAVTAGCGYVMLHDYIVTQHIDRYRGVKV